MYILVRVTLPLPISYCKWWILNPLLAFFFLLIHSVHMCIWIKLSMIKVPCQVNEALHFTLNNLEVYSASATVSQPVTWLFETLPLNFALWIQVVAAQQFGNLSRVYPASQIGSSLPQPRIGWEEDGCMDKVVYHSRFGSAIIGTCWGA